MTVLREVSNTRYRQMVHYCSRDNYALLNVGGSVKEMAWLMGIGVRPSGSVTITPSHPRKGVKKRDLRSLDYHAKLVAKPA